MSSSAEDTSVEENTTPAVVTNDEQGDEAIPAEPPQIENNPSDDDDNDVEEEEEEEEEDSKFESNIMPFKAIHSFVTSMNAEFGARDKQLRLYARLIEQTTFSHELPIRKHVQSFRNFCIYNRESIFAKNFDTFTQNKISYSERVFIDMNVVFKLADHDQRGVMWQHLLTISALVDPTGRAKQILKSAKSTKEGNFLNKIIEKVEQSTNAAGDSKNPLDMINGIMNSGVLTDLMGSLNNNSQGGGGGNGGEGLDFGKMMGLVQNMIGTFTKDQPELQNLMGTLMKGMDTIKTNAPSSNAAPTPPSPSGPSADNVD
jgi:hypothetical protein